MLADYHMLNVLPASLQGNLETKEAEHTASSFLMQVLPMLEKVALIC